MVMFKYSEDAFMDRRKQDLEYLKYYIDHKLDVNRAGKQLELPLSTRIKHDWSKMLPSIWVPHRDYFYGSHGLNGTNERETYLKYVEARKKHMQKEPIHHILPKTTAGELESVADWYAVYTAQLKQKNDPNVPSFKDWWAPRKLKYSYRMSEDTYKKINQLLNTDAAF